MEGGPPSHSWGVGLSILTTLVLLACPLLVSFQGERAPPQEQVASTCETLMKALEKNASVENALRSLHAAVAVVDARVIEMIDTKGLRHDDPAVRDAAVEGLGRMHHPAALKALHDALKRDKKELQTSPPRYATLLRAIARHGKESSIPDLVEGAFQSTDRSVITARILGLACVRSSRSVDELIRLVRSSHRSWDGSQMPDFRLALVVLTGVDKGTDRQLWINWYGDHKGKIAVATVPPELPRELRKRWDSYWGETVEQDKKEDKDGGKGTASGG